MTMASLQLFLCFVLSLSHSQAIMFVSIEVVKKQLLKSVRKVVIGTQCIFFHFHVFSIVPLVDVAILVSEIVTGN